MVDGARVTDFEELAYTDGDTALTATLHADNTGRSSTRAATPRPRSGDGLPRLASSRP
jgi:hypothetical protein